MFQIGDTFINSRTGNVAHIVETRTTFPRGQMTTRYRLSGETRYLSARQLRQEYEPVGEPEMQFSQRR